MNATAWWRDFRFERGVVHVKKTGAAVPVEPGVVGEVLTWLVFHLRLELTRPGRRADGPRVWFAPDRPRPWYLIWPTAQFAGLRFASSSEEADLGFLFEDATEGRDPQAPAGLPMINAACLDVSKSRVARVFEAVSGRALAVDPRRHDGPMVEKSELNGAHDGRAVDGPLPEPRDDRVYQRLIDNLAPDGCVEDLRCPTVGGEIPVVYLKRRPLDQRFANMNTQVRLLEPDAVFSAQELATLSRFAREMGLEWGGMDVLRDRRSGELWIVDVNKTDMGPPIALPLRDKLASVKRLAAALRAYCERRAAGAGKDTPA